MISEDGFGEGGSGGGFSDFLFLRNFDFLILFEGLFWDTGCCFLKFDAKLSLEKASYFVWGCLSSLSLTHAGELWPAQDSGLRNGLEWAFKTSRMFENLEPRT